MERKLRILIADDEEGLRLSMGGILEFEGYDVKTAADGYEAIEMVKNEPFDIAFLDIRMPGLNGVEAFKTIKTINPRIVVVMMTAFAVNDLITEAINEGAYTCISKPFDMDRILETVKEVSSKPLVMIVEDDPSLSKALAEKFGGNGLKVCVVDDDKAVCDSLQHVLATEGYKVDVAYNGNEAVEKIKSVGYKVVVLDIRLPDINGLELYERIKGINPEVGVIFISGAADNDVQESIKRNNYIFLHKPFDPENLLQMLSKLKVKE